ncbi:origin recognition complex subunit 3 N-terminus-domain-containing protein [Apiosordaria backusii]|uniref:Origin recognition complex subunit 3 N-terminus-domain-containing protein n=1 Tax=Apiosordaria backusii TaxID=314023 RepID=A0AA40BNX5_9PEZI|nr:origin recognition complex subunit 3 N-terminus-domain-containing protein [Apiosordaria backusii]
MAEIDDTSLFQEDDHRVAYIFTPPTTSTSATSPTTTAKTTPGRPAKRRRVSKKGTPSSQRQNDGESPQCAKLRKQTYESAWPVLEQQIQTVLRDANRQTLDEVVSFFNSDAQEKEGKGRIPAGFIITGPNIAGQDLLFGQLGEALTTTGGKGARFIRLRAGEVGNLKGALKKIVREGMNTGGEGQEGEGQEGEEGAFGGEWKREGGERTVIVAFQDSEAFDTGLVGELVGLFHSWQDRIQFSVLFGIATSVELFQARLLKSTARQLYGAQFDVVQANAVLESVIMAAVAGTKARHLRIGPGLLRKLVRRQQEHVAGVGAFVSSLKYAYMNHFYANPLSVLLANDGKIDKEILQPEHLEAVRMLESFKSHVELAVEAGQLGHAQKLLDDDEYLKNQVLEQADKRQKYMESLLRSLALVTATELSKRSFIELYETALEEGISLDQSPGPFDLGDAIKRSNPEELINLIDRVVNAIEDGNPSFGLEGWASDPDAEAAIENFKELRFDVERLLAESKEKGASLKSKYSSQSKVLRTTVVAQKVQLSRDTATLTEEDNAFTEAIDAFFGFFSRIVDCEPLSSLFLHKIWQYDYHLPYEDVFVPRPGGTFARALSRPHDYLGCACCDKANGSLAGTLPATSILYHLYSEAGALINVADLWVAYYALVGEESEIGMDERSALVLFYRGLAELRAMGFVKQSKKKADHIAKLKWL